MSDEKKLMWKTASTHGLIVGAILIVMALLVWVAGIQQAVWLRYMNWTLVIGSVYYSMKNWRDQYLGGFIRYRQALGYGVAVMFFASIVFGFYNIVYINYLDPESLQRSLDFVEQTYYERGMAEEQIELAMELAERMQTPFFQAISTMFGTTFLGLLISLIVALFIRKEGDPFQQVMKNVPEVINEDQDAEIE